MNTGYIIKQYIDINPLSPTYNQTWTERTLDTDHCPQSADDWVEVGNYCEVVDVSGYTGNRQIVYYSDSINAYSSVTYPDATCNVDSKEENWVNEGEPYCEIGEDGKNTGYMIQIQKQKNPNLINYGDTREFKYLSDECGQPTPTGDTCPHWQEIMRYCYVINDSGTTMLDGSANVAQIDNNEASDTYNQTRTINVYDSGCSNMAGTVFEWTEIGDYCGGSGILCDEGISSVKTTLYTVYRRTKTLNGVTTNMGEYSAVTKEIGSQSCGADVRRQWVKTDNTECVNELAKAILTLNDDSKVEIPGSGELTSAETKAYSATTTNVEITTACTGIGDWAFFEYRSLASVIIPDSVTSIGNYAFYACSSLTSVTIPDSVTSIGDMAFGLCSVLASVTIGSGITSIGNSVFSYCRNLTSIIIPDSVTSIGNSAFIGCSSLTSITIPSGVTSIGGSAFFDCSGLTEITVEAITPPTLGSDLVFYNTNYCPIYVPCESVEGYKAAANWSTYESRIQCKIIYRWIVMTGATDYVCSGTSKYAKEKKQYSIDSGTTWNDVSPAEYRRGNLIEEQSTDCGYVPPTPPTGDGKAILYLRDGSTVTISGSGELTSAETSQYSATTIAVEIGTACTSLGNYAFSDYSGLTSVVIPSNVTSIGMGTFTRCKNMTSVTIPDSVTVIGSTAFISCRRLTSVAIPSGVTSISSSVFYGCSGLTSVTIPNKVTSIGMAAFEICSGLTSIIVEATTPPTLGYTNVFNNTNNCPIYVPAESVNAYKTATYWSTYASRITAIP